MNDSSPKYVRRPFPMHTLQDALPVAQAIQDQNNGKPMNRLLLADAIQRKPASSEFKALLSSSLKYGMTTGTEKSEMISLEELGDSLTRPRNSTERSSALKKAALQPELLRRIYEHYNNGKMPQGDFFSSVLERDFKVPRGRCGECAELLTENGRFAGIVRELQGALYVLLEGEPTNGHADDEVAGVMSETETGAQQVVQEPPSHDQSESTKERYIFVAHGKNRKPLEQLEKVLEQFGIPYKVAVYEPQMARPISVKVAEVMRECHSAILIFTADEEYKTLDDQTTWRPNQNVIYELGAASILYENRVVIFKEEGLDFPTDFHDIGYISFEKDKLDAKGVDLVQELIAIKLIKVQPA